MLTKTSGIVLNHIRFGDNGLVVNAYTREFGRQNYLINSTRGKKSPFKLNLFQPLTLLELEVQVKETRSLQRIKNLAPKPALHNISQHMLKSVLALFFSEVILKCIREEEKNSNLYDFLESTILYLENTENTVANFHIYFLLEFAAFMGFKPLDNYSESTTYFDLENGQFVPFRRSDEICLSKDNSLIVHKFLAGSIDESLQISLTSNLRAELIENLLRYYRLHNEGIAPIKSIQVLREVFR